MFRPFHVNGEPYVDPLQPVLEAQPLRTVPYMGPPLVPFARPSPLKKNNDGPTAVFMSTCPSQDVKKNILSAAEGGVILTGSAALGKMGRLIGSLEFGESEDAYFFRLSLPGVSPDRNQLSCEIEPSGKIVIKGITTTGEERVFKYSQVFEMKTQNLCPPGFFSVTFQLPGPVAVDNQTFPGSFTHGMLVGNVKKRAVEV